MQEIACLGALQDRLVADQTEGTTVCIRCCVAAHVFSGGYFLDTVQTNESNAKKTWIFRIADGQFVLTSENVESI